MKRTGSTSGTACLISANAVICTGSGFGLERGIEREFPTDDTLNN